MCNMIVILLKSNVKWKCLIDMGTIYVRKNIRKVYPSPSHNYKCVFEIILRDTVVGAGGGGGIVHPNNYN